MALDKQTLAKLLSIMASKNGQQTQQEQPSQPPSQQQPWTASSVFGDRNLSKMAVSRPVYSLNDMLDYYNSKIDKLYKNQLGTKHDILNPEYNYEDSIVLKTGKFNLAKVPKKLINDVMDTSKRTGVDFYDLMGLIGQESTFGGGLDISSKSRVSKQDLVSGWDLEQKFKPKDPYMFLADNKAEGVEVKKTPHGWYAEVTDENKLKNWINKNPKVASKYVQLVQTSQAPESINWLDEAANRIKSKGIQSYNAGDKDYSNKVKKSKELLMSDPALMEYLKSLAK